MLAGCGSHYYPLGLVLESIPGPRADVEEIARLEEQLRAAQCTSRAVRAPIPFYPSFPPHLAEALQQSGGHLSGGWMADQAASIRAAHAEMVRTQPIRARLSDDEVCNLEQQLARAREAFVARWGHDVEVHLR